MAIYQRGDTTIYYETRGDGFPLLLIPPGGMNSTISFWDRSPYAPMEIFPREGYWSISLDARNAGQSSGPLNVDDPWGSYAEDQLNLMSHLGVDRFCVLGMCIGCSYALSLIQRAPERIVSAVLQQPIGISVENKDHLATELWTRWGKELVDKRPELDFSSVEAFANNMFGGDFVFSVSRDFVRECTTPLLVMPGNNLHHPRSIGMEVASVAPNAELLEEWREPPEVVPPAVARIKSFLKSHIP